MNDSASPENIDDSTPPSSVESEVIVTVTPPKKRFSPKNLLRRLGFSITFLGWRIRCWRLVRSRPDEAAAMVSQLWCKLPQNGGRRKDLRPYPGTMSYVPGPNGAQLAVETWGSGPRVYLVHGWGGWRGQLGSFVEPLVEAGHQVIGFDALSHGESEPGEWGPKVSNGGELTRSLQAVISACGPARGIVAHSLGCATSTWTAVNSASSAWLALVAPNPDLVPQVERFASALGIPESLFPQVVAEMAAMAKIRVNAFAIVTTMTGRTLAPVLVVHDRLDKECSYQTSVDLAQAVPEITFKTTVGLGHQRILSNSEVVQCVASWAKDHQAKA